MSLIKDAIDALGELIIMGFQGLELSDETSTFLSQSKIGGIILFSHNYESPAQLAELNSQIRDSRPNDLLWISADQEGGRVQRFKKGFTRIPPAAAIGAMNSPKLTFEISELIAKELKAVGVNLNFAPVADINTNPKNPVIGDRAFGSNEELVTKMVIPFIRGHLTQGVLPCVKHFPGHGDTHLDSHFALPRVDTTLEQLKERELKPFMKAFRSKCPAVMTSHIIWAELDLQFPGTLSKKVIRDFLRKELHYDRIIFTDDMEMGAITNHYGADEAPRLALEAGCDQIVYRSEQAARRGYEALIHALEKGSLNPEIVLEASTRILAIKKEYLSEWRPTPISEIGKIVGSPEHLALIQKVDQNSLKG